MLARLLISFVLPLFIFIVNQLNRCFINLLIFSYYRLPKTRFLLLKGEWVAFQLPFIKVAFYTPNYLSIRQVSSTVYCCYLKEAQKELAKWRWRNTSYLIYQDNSGRTDTRLWVRKGLHILASLRARGYNNNLLLQPRLQTIPQTSRITNTHTYWGSDNNEFSLMKRGSDSNEFTLIKRVY